MSAYIVQRLAQAALVLAGISMALSVCRDGEMPLPGHQSSTAPRALFT